MASAQSTSIRRVTQAELARELGVSRQAIAQHVADGTLPIGPDKKIDYDLARVALANRVRPSSKTGQALAAPAQPPQGLAPSNAKPTESDAGADEDAASTSYHVARTLRETEEARMAKLKRLEMEAKLTDAQAAGMAITTAFRLLRDMLMPLGKSVSGRLVGITDPAQIRTVIDAELAKSLKGFADKVLPELLAEHGAKAKPTAANADA